jgi:TatD DNase family protein
MLPAIVDSHCHLDFDHFAGRIGEVIARARDNGVHLMVTVSTRVKQFERIRAIAEGHEEVYCTVGTHPHNAREETDVTVADLVRLAAHPKVVGIGEAGLDYHYDLSPREAQAASFRTHIRAAQETGLPLVVHSREAEDDTARMLEEEMGEGAFKPHLHCFASKPELARRGLAIGAYVSFSGILTFKAASDIHEAARFTPLDRVLVETDAPYLAPVPHRGKPNEPAFVRHTLDALARIKGVSPEEAARATSDNFFTLFSKASRPPAFRVGPA